MSIWNKKYTLKQIFSFNEGGDIADSKKPIIFATPNSTKDEINSIISGASSVTNGENIQAIARYLRRGEGASEMAKSKRFGSTEFNKKEDPERLNEYIDKNNLWIDIDSSKFLSEGFEQQVYFLDNKNVTKLSNAIFYNSWLDYFNNLLLHNYFFPATAYKLVGFYKLSHITLAAVEQPWIRVSQKTDLSRVKKFMHKVGFENTKKNDYYNEKLRVILEDLHDENVLTEDNVPYFIDTVFYLK